MSSDSHELIIITSEQVPQRHTRREALLRILGWTGAGVIGVAAGYGIRSSQETPQLAPYPFTRADLDAMNPSGHVIQVHPANSNDQIYLSLGTVPSEAEKTVYIDAYVSIDGGRTWAGKDRPPANGLNKDPNTIVRAVSFGGHDTNAVSHGVGGAFQVTYQNGAQISVELAVATANGIETIDVESAQMTIASDAQGGWSRDEHNNLQYTLNGTDQQQQSVAIIVGEPSGK